MLSRYSNKIESVGFKSVCISAILLESDVNNEDFYFLTACPTAWLENSRHRYKKWRGCYPMYEWTYLLRPYLTA